MSFLTPIAFALTALLPVIIAMYLLKLRREERIVSSLYLWRKMVQDVEANAPWQRLRRNLLLVLQILFLVALVLALARPFLWTEGVTGRHVIFIVDNSASMAASDAPPSRLATAKARAKEVVAGLPDSARATVITAGGDTQVVASATSDRRQLRQALNGISGASGASDLTAAINLAAAIAARQPDTEVVILSDGNVTLPSGFAGAGRAALSVPAVVHYIPIGVSDDNVALSALSLRSSAGGQVSLFIQAVNYGHRPARRRLSIYADNGLFDVHDIDIDATDQKALVIEDLPGDVRVVEARLEGQDALALDDRAWAVRRSEESTAVTLVSEGNLFLETALALLPSLEVSMVKPAEYAAGQSSNLTIFDAGVPVTGTLPAENLLFVAPLRSTALFTVTGVLDDPLPLAASPDEPLLRHVDLRDVQVLKAARLTLPDWGRPVMVSGRDVAAPLLFVGEVDARRVGVLAFDLHHTDLVLHPAFPLLLSQLMGYLAPGAGGELPDQIGPGQALTVHTMPGVSEVVVEKPDGERTRLIPDAGQATFAHTDDLGIYRISWQDGTTAQRSVAVAVNLFSPQESNIAPRESLAIGGEVSAGASEAHPLLGRRELWRLVGMASLAVLLVEWFVYQRGAVARVMGWIRSHKPAHLIKEKGTRG